MMMMMRVIQRKKTHVHEKFCEEESQKIFQNFYFTTLCFETRRILVTFIAHQSR